jgi:hypothetical protein
MGIVTAAGKVVPGAMVHLLPPQPWFPPPAL